MDFIMDEKELNESFEGFDYVPESTTLTLDTNHIHYVHVNRGKPNLAVFVHGSPGSWSAFVDFFKNDSLLSRYDVVSIDRPGFGTSDHGRPEPSLKMQARLLIGVIEKFKHQNIVLIGHSLGGSVVARMAMDYPELVSSLILVAPSVDPELENPEWYRSILQTKLGGYLTPTDFWVSNEEIVPLKKELQEMLPLWSQLDIPVIVIHGTEDMLVPVENADFVDRVMKDSLVEIWYLKGVNHFIPWTNPEPIIQALYRLQSY